VNFRYCRSSILQTGCRTDSVTTGWRLFLQPNGWVGRCYISHCTADTKQEADVWFKTLATWELIPTAIGEKPSSLLS